MGSVLRVSVDARSDDGGHWAVLIFSKACGECDSTHTGIDAARHITHTGVPDDLVAQVLGLLLDGAGELAQTYYRAGFISRETVRLGIAVPLHPAAEGFYAER